MRCNLVRSHRALSHVCPEGERRRISHVCTEWQVLHRILGCVRVPTSLPYRAGTVCVPDRGRGSGHGLEGSHKTLPSCAELRKSRGELYSILSGRGLAP